ncbi:hypothetical protein UFOVP152_3 [uncultured Caudovirales phage]|uniref:Lysis protein n=1 Tax=uncultured Caudovirales phage TaxID=2100421 RepID=A0A6J7WDJ7_9CAUD|nr:hypothetical protein UFOVP152_3 [uncultured Caudovirales phage]
MISLLLTRWRFGLSIAATLAFIGLGLAERHYRHAYRLEHSLRLADHERYVTAQAEAARIAQAALRHQEVVYQEKANETDRKSAVALADAQSRLAGYASTHRVRFQAAGGASGGTASGSQGGSAQSGNGPGQAADMVAVTDGDLAICTENTTRLEAVREWALGL